MRKLRRLTGGRLLPCILSAFFAALALGAVTVFLPRLAAPAALLGYLFSVTAAILVADSASPAEDRLSWLVLISALPWTGALLALWWKPSPSPVSSPSSLGAGRRNRVGSLCKAAGNPPVCAESVRYFPVGKEMAESLLADLEGAKNRIFLEYYIVDSGVFFSDLLRILTARAREGVDVRLLYDDFGCSLTLPADFSKTMGGFGIRARPFRKLTFSRAASRRDHRKIAVIDGEIAYTGGVNLADEYVGKRIRFGHWKDTAVRVTGEPAALFETLFLDHWKEDARKKSRKNTPSPQKIRAKSEAPDANSGGFDEKTEGVEGISKNFRASPENTGEGTPRIPCAVLSDDADGGDGGSRTGIKVLRLLALSAERTLYLTTPYLAPDETLLSALKTAAASGTDVRILIPHIPDKKLPFLLTRSYARELERAGVQVREYAAGFMHAKNLVTDGRYTLISTYNLDFRSLWIQAECGIFIEDEGTAREVEKDFLGDWKAGMSVKRAKFSERLLSPLLRLLSPLL